MANMVLSSENLDSSNRVSTTCDDGRTYVFVSNDVVSRGGNLVTKSSKTSNKVATKRPRADSSSSNNSNPPELMRCKRRINFAGYSLPHQPTTTATSSNNQHPPTAVARRNERERNRVKLVNLGFATLREHVPNGTKNKKMSKVETLRSAVEYIRKLQELLDSDDGALDALFADAAASAAAADVIASPSPSSCEQNENVHPSSQQSSVTSPLSVSSSTSSLGSLSSSSSMNPTSNTELCYSIVRNVHDNLSSSTSSLVTGSSVVVTSGNNNGGLVTCPPSSVSPTCSVASSPTPSECSFYEPLSPEEAELLDFTNWFT